MNCELSFHQIFLMLLRIFLFPFLAQILEYLHPVVIGIHNIYPVFFIHIYACGEPEMSWFMPRSSYEKKGLPLVIEYLKVVKCSISNINMPFTVNSDALRTGKCPWSISIWPNLLQIYRLYQTPEP